MNHKPFEIPKRLVWEAWKKVKSSKGGPGIDGVSLENYEEHLSGNLYKLWNRMSSGSYFPKPVKQVDIPKALGGTRSLNVPTVEDRIAQTVVRLQLEPSLEKLFHTDSYGARPGKSAHDALNTCRSRCWKSNWVLDIDIASYYDSIEHSLLMKAVQKHATTRWEILYIQRWISAPIAVGDGSLTLKEGKGIPQGATISPVLSNLFLHYALDEWMKRTNPNIPFERFLDDAVYHCNTRREAMKLKESIAERLKSVGLTLHPEKSEVVYSGRHKQGKKSPYSKVKFTFLGYEFKPRNTRSPDGRLSQGFTPGVGKKGKKNLKAKLRQMGIFNHTNLTLEQIAKRVNPIVRGWCNYYTKFRPSEAHATLGRINYAIVRWFRRKYKLHTLQAIRRLRRIQKQQPKLFYHWELKVLH